MTVKQTVLGYLKGEYPIAYTNNEIAYNLGIPEPSVRRATLTLERALSIHFNGQTTFGRNLWMANGGI